MRKPRQAEDHYHSFGKCAYLFQDCCRTKNFDTTPALVATLIYKLHFSLVNQTGRLIPIDPNQEAATTAKQIMFSSYFLSMNVVGYFIFGQEKVKKVLDNPSVMASTSFKST